MSYLDLSTKKAKVQYIRKQLGINPKWVQRGVVRIFENQTMDEQTCETTREHNGIGFTGSDANILSSFAKQIIAGRNMSVKQNALLFKKMPKYAGQLQRMKKVQEPVIETTDDYLKSLDDETITIKLDESIAFLKYCDDNSEMYQHDTYDMREAARLTHGELEREYELRKIK